MHGKHHWTHVRGRNLNTLLLWVSKIYVYLFDFIEKREIEKIFLNKKK